MKALRALLEQTRPTAEMLEKIGKDMDCHPEREVGGSAFPFAARDSQLGTSVGTPLSQLLKRPEVRIEHLLPALADHRPPTTDRWELKSVETELKYSGYLDQQSRAIERLKKAEQRAIPEWFDYASVSGLSREMKEKLLRVRPRTLAQASRIPGVTPAAVSLVHVFIEIQARRHTQTAALQP